jgi:protein arginine kinase
MRSVKPSVLPPVMPWLSKPHADGDVALGARVRLGRNLAEYPFADTGADSYTYWDAVTLCQDAVEQEASGTLELLHIDGISLHDEQAAFLRDRALLERTVPAALAVDSEEHTAFLFGGRDHLAITTIEPGSDVAAAYKRALHWDLQLEQQLNFAVALDWGYLSTDISELGTAMRCSVLVHLPATVELEQLPGLDASIQMLGMQLRRMTDECAALFWLENRFTIGMSEETIISKLEEAVASVVSFERTARAELLRERRTEVAERAHRAYGLLQFSRAFSSEEALQFASDLRLGVICQLVSAIDTGLANSLFFLARDGHIDVYCDEYESEEEGERNINQARAHLVQELLRDEPPAAGGLGGIIDV